MIYLKKTIAAAAALSILVSCIPSVAAEDISTKVDYIDFGGNSSGLTSGDTGEYREYDGYRGMYISADSGDKRLSFDISSFESGAAEITVWYYDLGTGYFTITYDGKSGDCDAELVKIENTGTWKSHTFYLYDAELKNGYNGYDFAINLNAATYELSRCSLTVRRVEVRENVQRGIEANASSERAGNIFIDGDDVKLDVEFKNVTYSRQEADVKYRLINEKSGKIVWSDTDKVSIGAKTPVVKKIEPELDEFGLFILETECTSPDGQYHSVSREKLSYSMKSEESNDTLGSVVHFSQRDSGAVAPLIAANGLGYIRDEFLWQDYEKQKGVYNFRPEWERYLGDVEKAGLKPLVILAFNNPLYHEGAACVPKTEEELKAYGDYVYNLVSFLGDRCNLYEVWNEPNLKTFSSDQSPEAYVPTLKVAYENVKRANPNAQVMGCATAGIDPDFFKVVFEMGGAEYMDILSYHFYFLDHKVMDDYVDLYGRIKEVDELCEQYNPKLKMSISEFGWAVNVYPTSPQMQLDNFLKTMAVFKRFPRMHSSFWYEYQDSGMSAYNKERNFGVVEYWEKETPYAAKPLYCGMSMYNSVIGSASLKDYYEKDKTYIYSFEKNSRGNNTMMMWAENKSESVSLKLGCESVTMYDTYGNKTILHSIDGAFTFMLQDRPVVVEGNFKEYELCEPKIQITNNGMMNAVAGEEYTFSLSALGDITAEFTPGDNVDIISQDGNTIRYIANADEGEQCKIGIRAFGDEKLYFEGDAVINVIPTVDGKILSLPYLDSFGKTVMCIGVKNNSSRVMSGTVELAAPKAFISKLSAARFSDLKPGKQEKCYIYLPSFSKGGHYDLEGLIKTDSGETFTVKSKYDRSFSKRTSVAPVIDGIISGGEYDEQYAMQTVEENKVDLFEGAIRNAQDISAKIYTAFDDEYMYVAVEATDDVHYQVENTANMWRGDGIQFGLCDKSTAAMVYKEIAVSLNGSTVQVTGSDDVKAAVKRIGNKTIYEMAVPFAGVFGEEWTVGDKSTIGFSMLVNDNDGPDARSSQSGRKGWVEYGSGIGSSKNTALYVDMKLIQ